MPKQVNTMPDGVLKSTKRKKTPERVNRPSNDYEREMAENEFRCSACGNIYTQQDKNFPHSNSPFFAGNNHRLTVCHKCLESFMKQYQSILGNQDDALRRMCLHLDMYLDERIIESTRAAALNCQTRIRRYISSLNLTREAARTYDDYIAEQQMFGINSSEEFEEKVTTKTPELTKEDFNFWGAGYTAEEMLLMKNHYNQLNDQRTSEDPMQEVYIRDLCELKVLQTRAFSKNDIDSIQKLKKLYQDTAKNANLNPISQRGKTKEGQEKMLGEYLSMIEMHCPAEYYKDKKLFSDFDKIGKYMERFILRPLKNLLIGSKELDAEYALGENETR